MALSTWICDARMDGRKGAAIGKSRFGKTIEPFLEKIYERVSGVSGYPADALKTPIILIDGPCLKKGNEAKVLEKAGGVIDGHTAALHPKPIFFRKDMENAARARNASFAEYFLDSKEGLASGNAYFGYSAQAGVIFDIGNWEVEKEIAAVRFISLAQMLNPEYAEGRIETDPTSEITDFSYALGHANAFWEIRAEIYEAMESAAYAGAMLLGGAHPMIRQFVLGRVELFSLFMERIIGFADKHGPDGIIAYFLALERLEHAPILETMSMQRMEMLQHCYGMDEEGLLREMMGLENALLLQNGLEKEAEKQVKERVERFFATIGG